MSRQGRTSPWLWVGVGCGALVLAAVVIVGLVVYLGVRTVREFEADLEDPQVRRRKVVELLGAEELPEGYHAAGALHFPFLMEVAILSDGELGARREFGHDLGEKAFIYVETRNSGRQRRQLEDFFEGTIDTRPDLPAFLDAQTPPNAGAEAPLARGSFSQGETDLRYIVMGGRFRKDEVESYRLMTMILLDCPVNDRLRLAVWTGADTEVDEATGGPALAGTVGDEAVIQEFMAHFHPCSR